MEGGLCWIISVETNYCKATKPLVFDHIANALVVVCPTQQKVCSAAQKSTHDLARSSVI